MMNAMMRKEYDSSVGPGVDGSAKRNDSSVRYDGNARLHESLAIRDAEYTIRRTVRHSGGGDG